MFLAAGNSVRAQDLEARIEALEQELKLLRSEIRNQVKAADDKAEAATAKAGSGARTKMKGPSPTWESEDGRYALSLTGRIHFDSAIYSQDAMPQAGGMERHQAQRPVQPIERRLGRAGDRGAL